MPIFLTVNTYPLYPGETFQASVVNSWTKTWNSAYHSEEYHRQYTEIMYYYSWFSIPPTSKQHLHRVLNNLHAAENLRPYFTPGPGISVYFYQTCPAGFDFSESEKSCVCEPRLAHHTKNCTITNRLGQTTCKSDQQFWIGYDNQSRSN